MLAHFVEGTPHRVAELRRIVPELLFDVVTLPTSFSTSAPDPHTRARDMVMAGPAPCFAEAVDLVDAAGHSFRLELDSENDNRFCRWRRETPAKMLVCVAVRREGSEVSYFSVEQEGRIADRPAGARDLGWDRLFIPAGHFLTMAQLIESAEHDGDPNRLRGRVYADVVRALH